MTVKTTTDAKGATAASPASGHDCCGDDAALELQNRTIKATDPAILGQAKPSKAAEATEATEACCCDGAGKK